MRAASAFCSFVKLRRFRLGILDILAHSAQSGVSTRPGEGQVISVTGDGDLPVLPELARTSSARWSRRHQAEGYVYYLGETAAEEGLFLMDHDLDGEIDEMSLLDYEAYYARLLDQALQYEAFY